MSPDVAQDLEVVERLRCAWAFTDDLFATLTPEALGRRPIRLRHPFIFYLGHLPAFSWNQLGAGLLGLGPHDAELDELFARGIDPADTDDPAADERAAWPSPDTVLAYRDAVRERLLERAPDVEAAGERDPMAARGRVWHVLLEHELMHHETLLYMLAATDRGLLRGPPHGRTGAAGAASRARPPGEEVVQRTIDVPAGEAVLGGDFDAQPFGWDNEFPRRRAPVEAFSIDRLPVTNARMLAFVEDGGYEDGRWWSEAGRQTLELYGLRHPHGWTRRHGGWAVRTPFGEAEWDADEASRWPASVSWVEAEAFARWSGRRLPTEAEWVRAVLGTPEGGQRPRPWGEAPLDGRRGNFDFARWEPSPVDAHPDGASAFGLLDAWGNGWEWTSTVFARHPGFEAYMPHYPGYSADFFDGEHRVMLGGSWATGGPLLRGTFRNWFQPRYPFVFSAFRLAGPAGREAAA